MDFFYYGEANVYQENLDSFLILAEEFQLKGLRGNQTEEKDSAEVLPPPEKNKDPTRLPKSKELVKQKPKSLMNKNESIESGIVQTKFETAVALTDGATNNTDIESLDKQVKSMITFSDNANPYTKIKEKARIC